MSISTALDLDQTVRIEARQLPPGSRLVWTATVSRPTDSQRKSPQPPPLQLVRDVGRAPSTTTWAITLLGAFRLTSNGVAVDAGPAGQRLLAALVCMGGCCARTKIAQLLWPAVGTARAQSNLRTTLFRLQRRLPGLVESNRTDLLLAPEVRSDVDAAHSLAATLLAAEPHANVEVIRYLPWHALAEDLLPDWDDEWLLDFQASFHRLRLDALERLTDILIGQHRYGAAVQAALAVLASDCLRETAHKQLISACLARGNRHDAISHYIRYRQVMRNELGLEPSPDLTELVWADAS